MAPRLITRLATRVATASTLEADAPERRTGFHGDFFMAIVSADGKRVSPPLPIGSPDALFEAVSAARPDTIPRGVDPLTFRVHGPLLWNREKPQFLSLEGQFARPGLRVRLRRDDEKATVVATVMTEAAPPPERRVRPCPWYGWQCRHI